jgi:putative transposase
MKRTPYPTDLTDAQWALLAPLLPPAKPGGRPRSVDLREIVNAILYQVRSGGAWRLLPHEFPPWGTVHYYYRRWRLDGTWQQVHDTLRAQVRTKAGRAATPSAAIVDSQSVKTTEKGGSVATTARRR